jgi:hypothetical protein
LSHDLSAGARVRLVRRGSYVGAPVGGSTLMQWDEKVFTDRDGYQTRPRVDDRDLCLTCGMPCSHVFDGLSFHPEHWVESTAAEREQRWQRVEQWMLAHPEDYLARLESPAQTGPNGANPSAARQPSTAASPATSSGRASRSRTGATSSVRTPARTPSRASAEAAEQQSTAASTGASYRAAASSGAGSGAMLGGRSRQRPPKGAATAPARSTFRAVAAVVDITTIWLPDGTTLPLQRPVRHLGDLEDLGRELNLGADPVKWRKQPEAGQVVPTAALWRQLGVDVDAIPQREDKRRAWLQQLSKDLPALHDAAAEGWIFGDGQSAPQLRGITRLRRQDATRGSVAVLCVQAMDSSLPAPDVEHPGQTARRLQLFADAVGIPFRGAISTGMDLLELVTPVERKRQWETVDYSDIGPASISMLDGVFDWTRRPEAEEAQLRYLHAYDRNGAYLAACSSVLVGLGRPQLYADGCAFDEKRAGWWLIKVPADTDRRFPGVLNPDGRTAGTEQWVTTTTLAYAVKEEGFTGPVLRAWLWTPEQTSRLLEPWYRILRDARTALIDSDDPQAPATLQLIKEIYKRTNGWFAATAARGTYAFQPYMHHAIRAASKVGMLHTVKAIGAQSGTWPLVVADTDVLAYASDAHDPAQAWPGRDEGKTRLGSKLGTGLGGYKPYRSGPLNKQLPLLTGRGWSGRENLTDVREWLATPEATDAISAGEA